jgi:serine/threonine protein kinase
VWRQLRHNNILTFLGLNMTAYPDNSLPSLLSPWMSYGSLKDYVRRPEYRPEEQVPQIVCDGLHMTASALIITEILGVANGIAYLHSLDITHGDIKPVCALIIEMSLYL